MSITTFKIIENKIILKSNGRICETTEELLATDLFKTVIEAAVQKLVKRRSILLGVFGKETVSKSDLEMLLETLGFLCKMPYNLIPKIVEGSDVFFRDRQLFNDFVEYIYNFWRGFDRFIICESEGDMLDKRPYRTFNDTIEKFTHIVRAAYRDIQENITQKHPNVYRQVGAGAEIAAIAVYRKIFDLDEKFEWLNSIPVIRQILIYPPLVLNPSMNKRTGRFEKIDKNPLDILKIEADEWLCYPAKVGPLLVMIYFQEKFYELGFSLCNLFELASDEDLEKAPDAIYFFGVPRDDLSTLAEYPTVFHDDPDSKMLVAAVPNDPEFGYFGYLKKMVLTLHNIQMMKMDRMPFHGALVKIILTDDLEATVLLIGDTGAGKSETLEALRILGSDDIKELIIIADDMGSLEINDSGDITGYGTETGAFLRLDDLQPGYAFGQIDRSIFMSPNQVNARVVLPVTTFETLIKGHRIDMVLYANNYEETDDAHPLVERFDSAVTALHVFREGAVMSKGTTTSKGLVHSYFANVFGPPQYREVHDRLAEKFFEAFFEKGVFVGQMRTRLGIPGYEIKGPELAAKELFEAIRKKGADRFNCFPEKCS